MDTPPDTKQAIVKARLQARARRISMLRRRVAAAALASFVLAWGVVAQSGSLGAAATPATGTSVTAATSVASDTSSATTADTSSSALTSVTTSQS